MTTAYKKKLIEVAIPLEAINAASAREKSIRHGHPSTLHLWWARRPLAACRAVLFAQLVDDPSSLPDQFPTHEDQEAERKRLFAIIEDLVKWENSTNEEVLERARAEIRRSCGGVLPPVYDPFSGGGSIPLEAQRLGLPAYGSDLNPVAVMIGKAMIEIPPKFKDMPPLHPGIKDRSFYRNAEGLAEDVKHYGEWMRERAWERIGHLYPQVDLPKECGGGKATVIAYLWARTVPCPDPAFSHVQTPLLSSFELSGKAANRACVDIVVDGDTYQFITKNARTGDKVAPRSGNVNRQGAFCLISGAAMPFKYIREKAKRGELGQKLLAIVADGPKGRVYISPTNELEASALAAHPKSHQPLEICHWPGRTNVVEYGMTEFGALFTDRQSVGLQTFSDLAVEVRNLIYSDALDSGLEDDSVTLDQGGNKARAYADAVSVYLSFLVGQLANHSSTVCGWNSPNQQMRSTFSRQALPMNWDFAEVNIFSESSGSYHSLFSRMIKGFETLGATDISGHIIQHDAQSVSYPAGSVISTDPPYYDNISYADLSDFFYLWMRQSLRSVYPELFSVLATPKQEELIAQPYRQGGKEDAEKFFLKGMTKAIGNIAAQTQSDYPATIYYAFRQSEIEKEGISSTGWATFIQSILDSGFSVVGTWPMRTEKPGRMISIGSNALANSVVLVCRKRSVEAETLTRAEFIRALKRELPRAIAELQAANIAPADMPQSAIGPGMGVFSRYKAVLESDDRPMSVKTALQLINRELDEYLGGIEGEFDADTRFAITWFQQNGNGKGDYGVADNLARARGIAVESVKHAGIVESAAGKVRILTRDELAEDWEPESDGHLTVWECLQHLVKAHERDGISHDTAVLLKKIGSQAEAVKDLAYCLYDISANKRKDAKEATAYNALIADWAELTKAAAAIHDTSGDRQARMDI